MNVVTASNGQILELDNMAMALVYDDDDILETATVVFQGVNYTQTATIENSLIVDISVWEPEDDSVPFAKSALRHNSKRAKKILMENPHLQKWKARHV